MITPFEYIAVLISIILGMGITQLISGLAGIVLRWANVKVYWPHLVLVVLIFIIHIQDWWATYELHTNTQWHLPMFLFIILYPVNLYILARILFPIRWTGKATNLRDFYFSNFRKIYFFMLFLPVHSILSNIFIGDYGLGDQVIQLTLMLILLLVVIFNNHKEWIHKALAILFLIICLITFIVGWSVFLIAA